MNEIELDQKNREDERYLLLVPKPREEFVPLKEVSRLIEYASWVRELDALGHACLRSTCLPFPPASVLLPS